MSERGTIPAEWRERNPLITEAGFRTVSRVLQHQHAPRWNFATGDRLLAHDVEEVEAFRARVFDERGGGTNDGRTPPSEMLERIEALRERVWWVRDNIPLGTDLCRDWAHLPTMTREDLAARIEMLVPWDIADLSRLIVYDTSGTTGHSLRLPHHPVMLGKNHPLVERALAVHGVRPTFDSSMVACANVCAQRHTYVFANPFSVWNDAAFVKVNLRAEDWAGGRSSARAFLPDLDPQIVTSDPISLAEAIRWEIDLKPLAVLSTAVELTAELVTRVKEHFRCPVINWYSTTETGPIAFSSPDGDGLEILPHDLFVEVVDDHGHPVEDDELGEVVVTGGRNPFLPLIRYRTGDRARIRRTPIPKLYDLRGRCAVFFRASEGAIVNAVDIGRALRLRSVFVQHQFTQHPDGSCVARIRPLAGVPPDIEGLEHDLRSLFGDHDVSVVVDEELGDDHPAGKLVTYVSEMEPR